MNISVEDKQGKKKREKIYIGKKYVLKDTIYSNSKKQWMVRWLNDRDSECKGGRENLWVHRN